MVADKKQEILKSQPSAWALPAARNCMFKVECVGDESTFAAIKPGDAMLLLDEAGEVAWGVRRVFLVRREADKSIVYFDRFLDFVQDMQIAMGDVKTLLEIGIGQVDSILGDYKTGRPKELGNPDDEDQLPLDFAGLCEHGVGDDKRGLTRRYIRELLETIVKDDLLGPAQGPEEEIVGSTVRARYIVGRLGPVRSLLEEAGGSSGDSEGEEAADEEAESSGVTHDQKADGADAAENEPEESVEDDLDSLKSSELTPSSMGMTFCIDATLPQVEVEVSWGKYTREKSATAVNKEGKPLLCWKRHPRGGKVTLALQEGQIQAVVPDAEEPNVVIAGIVSKPVGETGSRPVTLFLANRQVRPETKQDEAWLFQPVMKVRSPDGAAIFRKRPLPGLSENDVEMKTLDMIYRSKVEFAVGHNVSVHAVPSAEDHERAVEICTVSMPHYEVPATEVPTIKNGEQDLDLDMRKVAAAIRDSEGDAIRNGDLGVIVKEYAKWIAQRREEAESDGFDACYKEYALANLDKCEKMLERLKEGIEILAADANARKAFAFANEVMADQRVHSIYALLKRQKKEANLTEIEGLAKNHSWRPFQLAFMLLALPPLVNPMHKDRTEPVEAYADLLWFPTGGGKTEAYLGVAAFAMAIRRLQGNLGDLDSSRGLCVIMRYTLRLLTIQQFQRATALLCAMEVRRKGDVVTWGAEPFTLGLWVGNKTTPNKYEESRRIIARLRNPSSVEVNGASPAQLKTCPWCGAEIDPKLNIDVHTDTESHRTVLHCSDSHCIFSASQNADGLPVKVVDEEMYHRPPSMMIATVDKFAQMAWEGPTRMLFGYAETECARHGLVLPDDDCKGNHPRHGALPTTHAKSVSRIRPPDLIIQDEFHLISGPLGTMVGLYETAVDELCTWKLGDKNVHPKVIASTATVRRADEQIKRVFCRECAVFPPSGIDATDNFFSRQDKKKSGRDYLGVSAPGSSRQEALIRTYAAFLAAGQNLFNSFGKLADPYMTAVGYFNSLRELGGMRRIAEDSVASLCNNIGDFNRVKRPGMSRRFINIIDELTSRVSSRDIPAKLDLLEREFNPDRKKGDPLATDIVLATNMLSVGVDVSRLGLMITNGQPKNTAEYIQATSRVGRQYPGVVCTVFAWARPRDFSHYEMFEHYHATFYKHVEAQSVTPFSKRALDRGLTGAFVGTTRLADATCAPNVGASDIKTGDPRTAHAKEAFVHRAENVMDSQEDGKWVGDELNLRIDNWVKEAGVAGRTLVYRKSGNNGTTFPLLKRSGVKAWDRWTVPTSMREVEGNVLLMASTKVLPLDQQNSHPWQAQPEDGDATVNPENTTMEQEA